MAQRAYEAMLIFDPNSGEERVSATTQRIQDQIATRGGQVLKTDTWGRRRMYYPIKHLRDGHYVVIGFNADPARVAELDAGWRIDEEVMRHLIVRQDD